MGTEIREAGNGESIGTASAGIGGIEASGEIGLGGRIFVMVCDKYGRQCHSFSEVKSYALDEVGGCRFIVDMLRQNQRSAEILGGFKTHCVEYYRALLELAEDGQLDSEGWDRIFSALTNHIPGIYDRDDFLACEDQYTAWVFILASGLFEARQELLNEFAFYSDVNYLVKVKGLLSAMIFEAETLCESTGGFSRNEDFHQRIDLFSDAYCESWRLKSSKNCVYDPRNAYERQEIQREFKNLWGTIATSVGLFYDTLPIVNFLSPGGGSGKSVTAAILAHITRREGRKFLLQEGADISLAIAALSEESWDRIVEYLGKIMIEEVPYMKDTLQVLIRRNFETYMNLRGGQKGVLIDRHLHWLLGLSDEERQRAVGFIDSMGLPLLLSILAQSVLNERLMGYQDLQDALLNSSDVWIPEELRYFIERLILKSGLLRYVLNITGRPIIGLDMPVALALERSAKSGDPHKQEKRARHDENRLALRLLTLVIGEMLVDDIAVVRCTVEDNGGYRKLSRVQVACACEIARACLDVKAAMGNYYGRPHQMIQEKLEGLMKRVMIMQEDLDILTPCPSSTTSLQ